MRLALSPPTYDQVRQLPVALERVITEAECDANGHLNVRCYLGMHDDAGWAYFGGMGFGEQYTKNERRGFFDLEQHLRYYAEVLVGESVAVHVRLLARSAKVVHAMSFLVNVSRQTVANTFEVVSAHVDLDERRTTPFDDASAQALDRQIHLDDILEWPAPICGALGVHS